MTGSWKVANIKAQALSPQVGLDKTLAGSLTAQEG